MLLQLTAETRLPVVAFLVLKHAVLELRWFTAVVEEEMCGHGTFAAAWVYFNVLKQSAQQVAFETRAGTLNVSRDRSQAEEQYVLDLPAKPPHQI